LAPKGGPTSRAAPAARDVIGLMIAAHGPAAFRRKLASRGKQTERAGPPSLRQLESERTYPWRRSEKSQQSLSRSGPRKEPRFLEGVGHQPPQLRWVAGRRTMPGAGRGPGRTPRGQPRAAQSRHLESPRPTGRRSTSAIRQVGRALRRAIHNSIQTTLRLKAASLFLPMAGALGWDGGRGRRRGTALRVAAVGVQ